jgi:hypothetical protein
MKNWSSESQVLACIVEALHVSDCLILLLRVVSQTICRGKTSPRNNPFRRSKSIMSVIYPLTMTFKFRCSAYIKPMYLLFPGFTTVPLIGGCSAINLMIVLLVILSIRGIYWNLYCYKHTEFFSIQCWVDTIGLCGIAYSIYGFKWHRQ